MLIGGERSSFPVGTELSPTSPPNGKKISGTRGSVRLATGTATTADSASTSSGRRTQRAMARRLQKSTPANWTTARLPCDQARLLLLLSWREKKASPKIRPGLNVKPGVASLRLRIVLGLDLVSGWLVRISECACICTNYCTNDLHAHTGSSRKQTTTKLSISRIKSWQSVPVKLDFFR